MSNGIPNPSPNLANPFFESFLSPSLLTTIPAIANGTNIKSPINILSKGIAKSVIYLKESAHIAKLVIFIYQY